MTSSGLTENSRITPSMAFILPRVDKLPAGQGVLVEEIPRTTVLTTGR